MCLPTAAACSTISAWSGVGVAMTTASIVASARTLRISASGARLKAFVIPTDEESEIALGTVQALTTVGVKAQVSGQVVKVNFTEGQDVKAGQLLFTIDARPFEATVAQAEAQAYLDAHARGPVPAFDADRVQRFIRRAGDMESTVARVGHRNEIPAAVAAYLDALELAQHLAAEGVDLAQALDRVAEELDAETIQVSIAHSYPGTELDDYMKKNNFFTQIEDMTDEMGHQLPTIQYPGLSREEIVAGELSSSPAPVVIRACAASRSAASRQNVARQCPQAQPVTSWSPGASATASAIRSSIGPSSPRMACAVAWKISAIGSVAR